MTGRTFTGSDLPGWYWLEAGGHELLHRIRLDDPHPYIDYYLARLWEDLNVLTPKVLEPVPDDLQPFIASDPARWACDPLEFVPEPNEERTDGVQAAAADLLDTQRAEHLRLMRELTRRKGTEDLPGQLIADHALFHLEADLRWLELTAARLDQLAKQVRP